MTRACGKPRPQCGMAVGEGDTVLGLEGVRGSTRNRKGVTRWGRACGCGTAWGGGVPQREVGHQEVGAGR